ncbi:A/G-specific adenine glycosylase, partial [Dietzia sp. HMSC21D01]
MTSPGAHGIDTRSLLSWFSRAGRPLPWREDGVSAWEILLCEVMSQQTPVTRVEPVWREWLARWPGPAELATASPAEVIRMWGKLGYPRRALRLRECAVVVVDTFGGEVPTDVEDLLSLPGVGDYTARAVACFAHGQAVPVVDTNVRRVVARAVNGVAEAGPPSIRRDLAAVEALLPDDREEAVAFSVAMMELGALVCTARSPDCDACPLAASCAWVAGGRPAWDGP